MTYALLFAILLATEIVIALFVRDAFVRPYVGDALVTVLICCFLRIFFPKGIKPLPVYVFCFAVFVEILQYFDVVKLIGMENDPLVSALLGRTFSVADIVCYAAGCIVFWLAEHFVRKAY